MERDINYKRLKELEGIYAYSFANYSDYIYIHIYIFKGRHAVSNSIKVVIVPGNC